MSRNIEENIAKALSVLASVSSRHPELKLEEELGEDNLTEIYIQAIKKANMDAKKREQEQGLFRVHWGHTASGKTYLYRLEDYEEVADRLEEAGDFPEELALPEEEGA